MYSVYTVYIFPQSRKIKNTINKKNIVTCDVVACDAKKKKKYRSQAGTFQKTR